MEERSKVGCIAALVTAVTYAAAAIMIAIATALEDPTTDDGTGGEIMFFVWCAITWVGTIAAVVVIYSLLKVTGGVQGAAARGAVAIAALAALGAFFTWAWFIWGILLSIAALLTALELRDRGFGITGAKSLWDWTIPAAWPVAVIAMSVVYAADWFWQNDDGLDWTYSVGFITGVLVTGATMLPVADWLRAPITAEPIESVDAGDI